MTNPDNRGVTEDDLAIFGNASQPPARVEETNKQPTPQAGKPTKQPAMRTNGKYPWTLWQNGEYQVVDPQVEFGLTTHKFQQRLHNRAHQEGLVVRTRNARDETGLGFQFFKDQKEALVKWEEEEYDDGYTEADK